MDALDALAPVSRDYASLPVADAFDWTEAGAALGEGEWYMVVFRSVRRPDADEATLTDYDDRAHVEASRSNGFVHYFKGPLAADGTCLSFCIWASRADARAASGKPLHAEAAGLVAEMYERYTLEFLRLRREAGGPLTFEAYDTQGRAPGPAAAPSPFVTAPGFSPAPTPS
jgi:hypothetical protein